MSLNTAESLTQSSYSEIALPVWALTEFCDPLTQSEIAELNATTSDYREDWVVECMVCYGE